MEIRTMRCCMCPNKEDSYICKPPKGYPDPDKQCNFVVDFRDRFGRTYSVRQIDNNFCSDLFEIKCMVSGGRAWNFIPWMHMHHTRDEAQEELNAIAIAKGWRPIEMAKGADL